ncbi:MAG: nucleoside monophosphate kinase [Verrucomicrobia bacterium]|nr:nucleoside monophosphate kinase [Verrucomicrobiota bacterium]
MKYRTILLLGAPGSGKGTQGKILGTVPGFFHCACGDVFRSLTITNPISRIFIEYSQHGKLVPDEPTVELWRQSIETATRAGRFHPETDILVLDGIPRNVKQAKILRETLDVMVHRLQRRALKENRLDDANLEVIRHRLKVYDRETKPLLKFYGRKCLHVIDATQTPVEVLNEILNHFTGLAAPEKTACPGPKGCANFSPRRRAAKK